MDINSTFISLKKYSYVPLAIFFLALTFRLFAIADMQLPEVDAEDYDQLALSIMHRAEFGYEPGKPTSWRPPFYPLFLSIVYMLGGHNYFFVGIVQSIIGALTCVFIYWIGREAFNASVGLISGLISACYMYFVATTKFLLSEGLFIFLFTASIYYLLRGVKYNSFKSMLTSGLLLALATLTRSITLLFPLFIFEFIFLIYRSNMKKLKMLAKLFIAMLIMFLIPISIWTARNYLVHRAFIPISTNGGISLFSGNTPDEQGRIRVRAPSDKERLEITQSSQSEVKRSKLYAQRALIYIKKHPNVVVKLMVMKFAFFWSPFDWCFFDSQGTYNYHYGFILPFALAAMFSLIKKWREYWLLYLPVIYVMGITLIFHAEPRYRMPIDPFLIIFFSYGIFSLFQRYFNKWIPIFMSASLFTINFWAYLCPGTVKEGAKYIFQRIGLW